MRKSIIFFILLVIPVLIFSATGNIAGKVVDKETQKAISNVTIQIKDSNLVAFSKSNGSFYLKHVPVGKQIVVAKILGYKTIEKEVEIQSNLTKNIRLELEREALQLRGMKISETRAKKRETPVAFTNVDKKQIEDKYTTEDVPMLLDNVPGLFSSAEGLGDAELTMRGFEADKIQVLINGIPVNDPESQKVYWSNWTGLSSNIKSVQVQRGASSSLYGSGVIGGSINIETMGTEAKRSLTLRTSFGGYGMDKGLTADGKGGFFDYDPMNYNILLRYNSGNLFDGKFNFSAMVEKKYGDSYIIGTKYDGYSFGLETQTLLGNHMINASFIGAPQHHNQARKTSDPYLFDKLGRNYNRDNHPYQKNFYFKPQFSLRDEWDVSENGQLVTNAFITKGSGGGQYLKNSTFNVDTGEVGFQDILPELTQDYKGQTADLGGNAYFLYTHYGILLDGYTPLGNAGTYVDPNGNSVIVTSSDDRALLATYNYSYKNVSYNDHVQFGINSYFRQKLSKELTLIAGYEIRKWHAKHYNLTKKFRMNNYAVLDDNISDLNDPSNIIVFDETQRGYDYTSDVLNVSGFLRTKFKIWEKFNIMADAQYAVYSSKVDENPVQIFDYAQGKFLDKYFYMTKDMLLLDQNKTPVLDSLGNLIKKYSDDDYKKTFKFLSPKFGINWNVNNAFNIIFNTSLAHKEPRVTEWYSRYEGPNAKQIYYKKVTQDSTGQQTMAVETYKKLVPETAKTVEFGVNYSSSIFNVDLNGYYTIYEDKIAKTVDDYNNKVVVNAGKAIHKGIEFNTTMRYFNWDGSLAATISKNTWDKMNLEKIFDIPANEVIGKHVPYSPENMLNTEIGYTMENMPLNGKIRLALNSKWWNNYWVSYTNEYEDYHADELAADSIDVDNRVYYDANGNEIHIIKDAKLPAYLNFGASVKYDFSIANKKVSLKLRFDNLLNKDDNYSAAYYGADYNRYRIVDGQKEKDALTSRKYMYVTPAPSFNVFLTAEVRF